MILPNFLIIGATKAGTTSLWAYLRDHPQVFMPASKELEFFVAERNWARGLDWYASHFEGAGDAIAIGEASPRYTRYPQFHGVPSRIAKVLPEVRLIYLIRHPIERMMSEYRFRVSREPRLARQPIENALLTSHHSLSSSCYAMQIEQYLQYFPRDQLLVVVSESMRRDRAATLQRICDFLRVNGNQLPVSIEEEFNTTKEIRAARPVPRRLQTLPGYRAARSLAPPSLKRLKSRLMTRKLDSRFSISESVRHELESKLADDVARLRRFLGPKFDGWGISIAAFFLSESVIEFL